MTSILDLPAEDVVYPHIFRHLRLEDVVSLRLASRDYEPLVDGFLELIKYVDWDGQSPTVLKVLGETTKSLREIDVSTNCYINDATINPILQRNKEVHTLIIISCCQITIAGIYPMVHFRNLTRLNLRKNVWVVDSFLHILTMNLHSDLLQIDLSMCPVSDVSLVPFFRKFKNLKDIDLEMVPMATDQTLYAIADNCSELVNLNVIWNKQMGERAIGAVINACKKLNTILMLGCDSATRSLRESILGYHI